ncbi:hydrogenase maturation nickel metallochaperone HypA [Methylocystis parvus]|uniref:Hydrogenase maturation factor HypA n=1 Tax=Methylocystis parvus TaxID=134 RepID=A0A6B8MBR9_9HYPH|nr:hydrogenase maturation nickel metallochaperone HypA [Methylocystis parvus]QGN00172.1 hydrogenase maturation nickel metallochaperone HypA [Methylocystis parvus]WBK02520.1 hydrogenase maturation nickel metallochaperone HypA [Methylocystis parvus OBBP]
MHELSIALSAIELAEQAANGRRIKRITLEIGELAGVAPEALFFCFDLATKDTLAEGAELEICARSGIARCEECQSTFPAPSRLAICDCGSPRICLVQGEELNVKSVEFCQARREGDGVAEQAERDR